MSVLIKGMKMPKSCMSCDFCYLPDEANEYHCAALEHKFLYPSSGYREDDCPLIEIPVPHGNLIDKLKLCHELKNRWVADDGLSFDIMNHVYEFFAHIVLAQNTVIEAEEKE